MKFYETHFEDYLIANQSIDLHPKLNKIYSKFPKNIHSLKNILFYGPPGSGKYTQVLKCIKKYSPSELKYEKKISITYNKQPYFFKISDIHYEIDMALLGCNSKLLWHDIYLQLIDIISAKTDKCGIILCKNFHEIHSELLENFYSYMQQNHSISIDLIFMILTEKISFIPDNILHCCEVIPISRPTKTLYNKCVRSKIQNTVLLENITNIKSIHQSSDALIIPHKIICDKIIYSIITIENIHFISFRDLIYDLFIYNLDITECIWYIVSTLISQGKIKGNHTSNLFIKIYKFLQYYNNNYRPIYHVEYLLFYIASIIHNF